jgi:hypothetical protein
MPAMLFVALSASSVSVHALFAVRCPGVQSSRPVSDRRASGHLVPSSGTDLSGRLVPPVRRPAVWCPSVLWRPSWVSPPWPWEHAGSAGPSRLEWVGSRVACRVPSGSSTARRPGRRRRCGGRGPTGREGAGREPGPVALGLRRRPRSAADRPGRQPGLRVAPRRRPTWARPRNYSPWSLSSLPPQVDGLGRVNELDGEDGRAAPARPSQEVSWPARRPQRFDLRQ